MPFIASHIPGRLRLRRPELRQPSVNADTVLAISAWEGMVSVQGKPASASILLHYDAARLPPAQAEARLALLFPETAANPVEAQLPETAGLSLWRLNRPAKIGMLAGLGGSLLALSVGKTLHAAFGALHVAFLLIHLANHRRKLLQ